MRNGMLGLHLLLELQPGTGCTSHSLGEGDHFHDPEMAEYLAEMGLVYVGGQVGDPDCYV